MSRCRAGKRPSALQSGLTGAASRSPSRPTAAPQKPASRARRCRCRCWGRRAAVWAAPAARRRLPPGAGAVPCTPAGDRMARGVGLEGSGVLVPQGRPGGHKRCSQARACLCSCMPGAAAAVCTRTWNMRWQWKGQTPEHREGQSRRAGSGMRLPGHLPPLHTPPAESLGSRLPVLAPSQASLLLPTHPGCQL